MAGIQVGGIVSGMDTNALVEKLIAQSKVPVDRLYGDFSYTKLEDEIYTDFNSKLGNLASDLLTLRLESTFKTKITTSTNDSVVTAYASTGAAVGNHSIQVDQLAKNSIASSAYTRYSLIESTAGVTSVTGIASETDYLEGVHEITVEQSGSYYMATSEFSVENVGMLRKSEGDVMANVSATGTLAVDFTGSFTVAYDDANGNSQTLTVSDTFGTTGQNINDIAANLEDAVNDEMNTAMGTNAVQYISFRAEYDSGSWNMAMYETTVEDHNISVGGTDAGSLRDELGFAEAYTPTTSSTSKMYRYHLADSLANLQIEAFNSNSGFIVGASIEGTLKVGTMKIAQDSSLNVSTDTYSSYLSAAASTGSGLTINTKGLDTAGFSETVDTGANGFFTINDVKITIEDYTQITVNDLLGIINSSGAGVTALYDSAADKFTIQSNQTGSTKINLGGYSDTSNILEIMKVDYSSSPTFKQGTTAGKISDSTKMTDAGFTVYPYSGTFTINGVSIYVDTSTESLNDVIEKVNKSGAGVTMAYDSTSDKITMVADGIDPIEVGSANDTSNLLVAFNLTDNPTVTKTIGTVGQRSILQVDGTTYVRESNTITDIVSGVTLSLHGASTTAASINVSTDTEKAAEAFASFIAHYNEIMAELNIPEEVDEEDNYTDYLTETKKKSMSDTAIEEYEEKYEKYNKYDIIRRSSELRNLDTVMRKNFFAERPGITSAINDMSDLGIEVAGAGDLDTEFYGYLVELSTDQSKIKEALLDNSDFMDALKDNPDDVFNFFAQSSSLVPLEDKTDDGVANGINYDNDNNSDNNADAGWARYFNDVLISRYTGEDGIIGNKLGLNGTINSELNALTKKIDAQEDRVESQLKRYWAEFTAMEKAIADAQAQAASFNKASSGSS